MISIEQISGEIAALEAEPPTFASMHKLADLYIVRDHMIVGTKSIAEAAPDVLPEMGDSEFFRAVTGQDAGKIWQIINETMETLKVMEPRLYNGVLRKIQE